MDHAPVSTMHGTYARGTIDSTSIQYVLVRTVPVRTYSCTCTGTVLRVPVRTRVLQGWVPIFNTTGTRGVTDSVNEVC